MFVARLRTVRLHGVREVDGAGVGPDLELVLVIAPGEHASSAWMRDGRVVVMPDLGAGVIDGDTFANIVARVPLLFSLVLVNDAAPRGCADGCGGLGACDASGVGRRRAGLLRRLCTRSARVFRVTV